MRGERQGKSVRDVRYRGFLTGVSGRAFQDECFATSVSRQDASGVSMKVPRLRPQFAGQCAEIAQVINDHMRDIVLVFHMALDA